MGVIPNIVNMVSGINQRKRAGRVRENMGNYLTDPEGTIAAIMEDDPDTALALKQQREQQRIQAEDRRRATFDRNVGFLRGAEDPEALASVLGPELQRQGTAPEGVTNLAQIVGADRTFANRRDPEAWKAQVEREMTPFTLQGGQQRFVGDQEVAAGRYKRQTVEVPRADGGVDIILFDPNVNGGEFVTEQGTPASPQQAAAAQAMMASTPEDVGGAFDSEFGTDARAPAATPQNKRSGGRLMAQRATGAQIEQVATSAVPGIRVTSRERTPERNEKVGGSPNSYHLTTRGGRARDFVPPEGMSMGQLASQLKQAYGPGFDVIDEGDHVHVEPGPGNGRGAASAQQAPSAAPRQAGVQVSPTRVSSAGANQPGRFRALSQQEIAQYPGVQSAQIDTQTGALTNIVRAPAAGRAGGETATQLKDRRKQEDKSEGQKRFSTLLSNLGVQYNKLRNIGGAIVDPSRGAGVNAQAWVNTTSVGRLLGRMGGDEAESIRQTIDNMRPLLIQSVREATDMSARAMDSNVELKFYMQSATDTGKDLVSNLAALATLDAMYGTGDSLSGLPADLKSMVVERMGEMQAEVPTDELPQAGQDEVAAPSSGWGQARVVN